MPILPKSDRFARGNQETTMKDAKEDFGARSKDIAHIQTRKVPEVISEEEILAVERYLLSEIDEVMKSSIK